MKTLQLHSFHQSKGAKFATFAGWAMPISYGSSIDEHLLTREKATFFDVSHMGEIEVKGKEATDFLSFVLTQNIKKFSVGKGIYSPLCNHLGGTIDDLICYKINEENYFLCVNASNTEKDYQHLLEISNNFECQVVNVSDKFGQLAVQGPRSQEILGAVLGDKISLLQKMDFGSFTFNSTEVIVARTGYTGEDGYELYCEQNTLLPVAEALDNLCFATGASWAGLAARDSLRLEAGFPLYGHELSEEISPLQAGLKWSVDLSKKDFVGKEALIEQFHDATKPLVKYFRVKGRRIPRAGSIISDSHTQVGKTLSGGYSPCAGQPIGSALINAKIGAKQGDTYFADVRGSEVEISTCAPILRELQKK
ncbi:MAG: glycine cleavage system aminomethyltransferase GcvT [Opitutales bacterium]|nr:glycine cleavage system aminomethyltransferase GcvT [Opitutales bacterium]